MKRGQPTAENMPSIDEEGTRQGTGATETAASTEIYEGNQRDTRTGPIGFQNGPGTAIEFTWNGIHIRTVLSGTEIWFVAADVCAVLEHTNPTKAVQRLDDDEKGLTTIQGSDVGQRVNVVNESGLYVLISTSRKPEARAFRRWVTGVVLPSIRKTGRYEHAPTSSPTEARREANTVAVELPAFGRFVVTTGVGHGPHIHQTPPEAGLSDMGSVANFPPGRDLFQARGLVYAASE